MSWLVIVWSMASAASLTLAVVDLYVWFHVRRRLAYLLFAVMALASAANALLELQMLTTTTIPAYDMWLRWEVVAVATILFSMVGLVRVHFGTGRRWLMWTIIALWVPGLVRSVIGPGNGVFTEITTLHQVSTFGGAVFTVAEGVRHPLTWLADVASVLILIYVVDAAVALARRGNRRRAWVVGGAIMVFMLVGGIEAPLVDLGVLKLPYIISLAFIAIVVAMGYELGTEVIESARLSEEVQASEQRWQSVMENIQLLVVGLDLDGRLNYVNPFALKITGYAQEDLLGRSFELLVPAEDRRRVRTLFEEARDSVDQPAVEVPLHTRDGKQRFVVWVSVRLSAVNSRPAILLSIGRDVTALREAEKMTAELRLELAHATRISALGELAGAVAHELNQPLGAILSNAEAAELLLQAEHPPLDEIREILSDIRRDDLCASEVIQRMRTLLAKHEFEARPLRLETVVEDVLQLIRPHMVEHHIVTDFQAEDSLPLVRADRIHLQQVLLNLALNSLAAVRDQPVEQRQIVFRIAPAGSGWLKVSVADTGKGIDPKHLPHLFEAFFTTKREGLGMGLSICRTIVEAHGGKIEARNNPDHGATVTFTLPVAEAAG